MKDLEDECDLHYVCLFMYLQVLLIHMNCLCSSSSHQELKEEHDQLNEVYSSLSIENLKLRDTVESLQKKLLDRQDRENLEVFNFSY